MTEDPILEKARQLRAAGASIDEVRSYLASKGYESGDAPITPGHSKFTPEELAVRADRAVAQSEDELEAAGGHNPTTHKIMGTVASLARDVPGAEVVQAFASSRANRIPYREALKTIRGVESDAGIAGVVGRIGGGALSAAMIPGSPVMQGARYGVARGLLQADPASVEDRLHDAAIEGSVGAIAPKVPGALARVAKGAAANIRNAADLALTPFSHGARVRTVGRFADLAREATNRGAKAAAPTASAPMVEGYQPVSALIARAPTQVLPFRAPAPREPTAAEQFAGLLQKNLDEGMEAAESVKGYPIRDDPASNPELMERIRQSLLKAKALRGGLP